MLKNFIKHYLTSIILVGFIIYLFLENITLKDELKELRGDIESIESEIGREIGELCPLTNPYLPGSGILGRLCDLVNTVEGLEYKLSNRSLVRNRSVNTYFTYSQPA